MSKRKVHKEDGLDLLMRSVVVRSTSKAILSQEADGQQSFVKSETLPVKMQGDARAVLKIAGVKFLGVVEDDPVFQYVELPEGWKKVGTGHSMWSDLVDDKGRKRARIFYKAAFYDRRAHLGVNYRYGISIDYERLDKGIAVAMAIDGGEVIFTTEPIEFEIDDCYAAQDKAYELVKAWLDENYPEWESATAYWD